MPNDTFMNEGVVNWSHSDRKLRLKVPFGVSYDTPDLELVQQLAIDAASAQNRTIPTPAPICNLMEFADSSVNFELRFWIVDPENGVANIKSAVQMEIWKQLKSHNIEIPFPQRDLHIKSGSLISMPKEVS